MLQAKTADRTGITTRVNRETIARSKSTAAVIGPHHCTVELESFEAAGFWFDMVSGVR